MAPDLGQPRLQQVPDLVAGEAELAVELLHGAFGSAVEAEPGPQHGAFRGGEVVEEVAIGVQAHDVEVGLCVGIDQVVD